MRQIVTALVGGIMGCITFNIIFNITDDPIKGMWGGLIACIIVGIIGYFSEESNS